jgi:hypothetical protein
MAVVLIAGALLGFAVGEHSILKPLDIYYFEDAVHLLLGGVLAYAGFTQHGRRFARAAIGGTGVLALLVGLASFTPMPHRFVADGLMPHGWGTAHMLLHFALGAPMIAAWYVSRHTRATQ